ncbi:MAG: glyceraldehyde 3-phosphate dehydrogenase NAD-binding domain-containing protein [Fidelibacterota bacterium]
MVELHDKGENDNHYRSVFRILNSRDNVDVVAINDLTTPDALTYLLKYETVMGRFPDTVTLEGDLLKTSRNSIWMLVLAG